MNIQHQECIVSLCMMSKMLCGMRTEHLLVFAMHADYLLMLQLYVAHVGLHLQLISFFVSLAESSISLWAMCEYFGTTLLCQSRLQNC